MSASSILVAYGARWVNISRCTRLGGGSKFLGSQLCSLDQNAERRLIGEGLDLGLGVAWRRHNDSIAQLLAATGRPPAPFRMKPRAHAASSPYR